MEGISVQQVSGATYFFPEIMPDLPKSALRIFHIADSFGNRGYCILVDNYYEKDPQRGIIFLTNSFAKKLLMCLYKGKNQFTAGNNLYRILSHNDEPRKNRIEDYNLIRVQEKYRQINDDTNEKLLTYLINDRHIQYLYHFTPYENLGGIAEYGIIPRSRCTGKVAPTYPDAKRYDNHKDFSSFSLSFPNDWYFAKKRNTIEGCYAVIELDINVLRYIRLENILFFPKNAACREYARSPLSEFQGIDAAKKLFTKEGRAYRLPLEYPTDSQAEVMLKAIIPTQFFTALYFDQKHENLLTHEEYPPEFTDIASCNEKFFLHRMDYYD